MSFEQIILSMSYFGIFMLLVFNGFVAFPSSQLVCVIAGIFVASNDLNIHLVIFFAGLGIACGNFILYEVSRRKGLKYSLKFFKFMSIMNPEREIKKIEVAFRKKGIWFLFIGKLVNPIKIFISIPAGITKMNRLLFFSIVWFTSTIWAGIFTYIGFYFGKSYEEFGFVGVIMLTIFGIVIYGFYKYINSEEILKEVDMK